MYNDLVNKEVFVEIATYSGTGVLSPAMMKGKVLEVRDEVLIFLSSEFSRYVSTGKQKFNCNTIYVPINRINFIIVI